MLIEDDLTARAGAGGGSRWVVIAFEAAARKVEVLKSPQNLTRLTSNAPFRRSWLSIMQKTLDLLFRESDHGRYPRERCAACLSWRRDVDAEGLCHPCSLLQYARQTVRSGPDR